MLTCCSAFIYDSIYRDLALQTSCAIVFPEYSLAPEKKFPTQIEECFEVMKFVAKGKNFGLQTRAFALVGDSAGGEYISNSACRAQPNSRLNLVFPAHKQLSTHRTNCPCSCHRCTRTPLASPYRAPSPLFASYRRS